MSAPRSPITSPPASPPASPPLPQRLGWSQEEASASQALTQVYEWSDEKGNYPHSQREEDDEEEDPFLAARRENGVRAEEHEEHEAEVTDTQSQREGQVGGGCDSQFDNADNRRWEEPVKSGLFVPAVVFGTTIVALDYKGWGPAFVAVALEHSRDNLAETSPTLLEFAEDPKSFCAKVCADLKHACGPPDTVMENLLWRLVAGAKMDAFNLSPHVGYLMSEVQALVSELRTVKAVVELAGTSEFGALDLADLIFEKVRGKLQRDGTLALVDFFNTPCETPQHLLPTFKAALEATAATTGCGFSLVCWEACLVLGCRGHLQLHFPPTRSLKRQRSTSE